MESWEGQSIRKQNKTKQNTKAQLGQGFTKTSEKEFRNNASGNDALQHAPARLWQ